jgi:hypothetical protein
VAAVCFIAALISETCFYLTRITVACPEQAGFYECTEQGGRSVYAACRHLGCDIVCILSYRRPAPFNRLLTTEAA